MYNPNSLSAMSFANGFTVWHYKTPDDYEEVASDGYFDDASGLIRVGDLIIINAEIESYGDNFLAFVREKNRNGQICISVQ